MYRQLGLIRRDVANLWVKLHPSLPFRHFANPYMAMAMAATVGVESTWPIA